MGKIEQWRKKVAERQRESDRLIAELPASDALADALATDTPFPMEIGNEPGQLGYTGRCYRCKVFVYSKSDVMCAPCLALWSDLKSQLNSGVSMEQIDRQWAFKPRDPVIPGLEEIKEADEIKRRNLAYWKRQSDGGIGRSRWGKPFSNFWT